MYRCKRPLVCWIAVTVLAVSLSLKPMPIHAQGRQGYQASAHSMGPIGIVRANGLLKINGRLTGGEQPVWGGDLLEASACGNSQVVIESVGEVSLIGDAKVRLSLGEQRAGGLSGRTVLVAALLCGGLSLRLAAEASAYVEACGRGFTSSAGAAFRVGIRDGRPFVDSERGAVEPAPSYLDDEITAESAIVDIRTGRVIGPAPRQTVVDKGKTKPYYVLARARPVRRRPTLVQVSSPAGTPANSQVQDDWKPANGKAVTFTLADPIGTLIAPNQQGLQVTVLTDPSGIATVTFRAERKGTTRLTATVAPGPGDIVVSGEVSWEITVTAPGFFRVRNLIIFGAIGTAATYPIWRPKKKMEQLPPPEIIP